MSWTHVLFAALAGGVALFIWNAVCWMALHHHDSDFRRMPKLAEVERALADAGVTPGMYSVPHVEDFPGGFKDPALAARWRTGPNATVVVMPAGECMQGSVFLFGFLVNVLQALGAAILFRYAAVNLFDLPRALGFGALLGALVHGSVFLSQSVWMKYPWSHALKSAFDGVVGYALVGLVCHFLR